VQAAAAGLERFCREQAPAAQIDAALQQVQAALEPVVAGLGTWLAGTAPAPAHPSPPAAAQAQVAAFATQLQALLADGDSGCLDLLAAHPGLLGQACPQHHKAIAAAMEGFDFEAALGLVRQSAAVSGS